MKHGWNTDCFPCLIGVPSVAHFLLFIYRTGTGSGDLPEISGARLQERAGGLPPQACGDYTYSEEILLKILSGLFR